MTAVLETLLILLAVTVLIPFAVLVVECLAALLLPNRSPAASSPRPACAVLVPAHDEETGIATTLASIQPQLGADDRLIVIADNCSDATAAVARTAGATAIERQDATRRGKGFALDFGVRHLEANSPPEIVVLLDADCTLTEGTIDRLVRQASATSRPVQAVYLMDSPPNPNARQQLSAFAFLFKNLVRPLGLYRLGLPCLLTGSGMAFPWAILRDLKLATSNIVEDMQMGIDLAVAGRSPQLCPEALVGSTLPTGQKGASTQRSRWVHGHLKTISTQVPRLLGLGLIQARWDLLGLALELAVPPLSLLFLFWMTAFLLAFMGWGAGASVWAISLLVGGLVAFVFALLGSWAKFGRERLPFASLVAAPFYIIWQMPIYLKLVRRPEQQWVRTERDAPPSQKQDAPSTP